MRSAYAFGIDAVVTIGITPHPQETNDVRLPHVIAKAEAAITKTALGGETLFERHYDSSEEFLKETASQALIAIELSDNSTLITEPMSIPDDAILILGSETDGVSEAVLSAAAQTLHIPVDPRKTSLNVAAAGAVAMYELSMRPRH